MKLFQYLWVVRETERNETTWAWRDVRKSSTFYFICSIQRLANKQTNLINGTPENKRTNHNSSYFHYVCFTDVNSLRSKIWHFSFFNLFDFICLMGYFQKHRFGISSHVTPQIYIGIRFHFLYTGRWSEIYRYLRFSTNGRD